MSEKEEQFVADGWKSASTCKLHAVVAETMLAHLDERTRGAMGWGGVGGCRGSGRRQKLPFLQHEGFPPLVGVPPTRSTVGSRTHVFHQPAESNAAGIVADKAAGLRRWLTLALNL